MNHTNLENILDNKETSIGNYENTCVYSKQLAEILLLEEKRIKDWLLFVHPLLFQQWNLLILVGGKYKQSYIILGISSDFSRASLQRQFSPKYVPVDLVADDCLMVIVDTEEKILKSTWCFNWRVRSWFSQESCNIIRDRAYEYYVVNPL